MPHLPGGRARRTEGKEEENSEATLEMAKNVHRAVCKAFQMTIATSPPIHRIR